MTKSFLLTEKPEAISALDIFKNWVPIIYIFNVCDVFRVVSLAWCKTAGCSPQCVFHPMQHFLLIKAPLVPSTSISNPAPLGSWASPWPAAGWKWEERNTRKHFVVVCYVLLLSERATRCAPLIPSYVVRFPCCAMSLNLIYCYQ